MPREKICGKCNGNHFYRTTSGVEKTCECVVEKPPYYTKGDVECKDGIKAAVSNLHSTDAHYTASAIQYLWRWKEKNGVEDLRKAKVFIEWLIKDQIS